MRIVFSRFFNFYTSTHKYVIISEYFYPIVLSMSMFNCKNLKGKLACSREVARFPCFWNHPLYQDVIHTQGRRSGITSGGGA